MIIGVRWNIVWQLHNEILNFLEFVFCIKRGDKELKRFRFMFLFSRTIKGGRLILHIMSFFIDSREPEQKGSGI